MCSQRREEVVGFSDVHTWNPSRWEDWNPSMMQYLPFNMAPRICLGRVFGTTQMEYLITRIIQQFERIEWCGYGDATPIEEAMRIKIELNTKFDKPIYCRFVPRKSQ